MKDNSGKSKMAFSRHRISLLNLLLLFVLAVAALSADFSAKGLLPVCFHRWGECLHFISAALGLNYNDSLEILEANYAVILAVVSVAVVVLPLLIADREKKIFGIRRDELREEPNGAHFIWSMVRVMTCMPVALLVAIMAGWCVTGYVLLFYTLVGMVAVSLYYLHSHIANAEADELTEWLFHYTDKTQYVYSRDIMAYREFLEDIESGADKGDDWHNVARVLRKLLKRALAKPPKQAYVTIYFYVAVLYRHVSANQRNCLLQIYNIWLECVLSENKACGQKPQAPDDEDDILQGWKEEVLLWAILSAAMEWATMENVVTFFEFYSDIAAESRRYYEQLGVEHAWESKTIKDAIVLLFMECWLRRCTADICDCRLPGYLKKIMDGAYRALKQEQELLKAICAAAYGSVYADDRSEAAALDALTRDAEEMSGMSAVSTVIMLEGKI